MCKTKRVVNIKHPGDGLKHPLVLLYPLQSTALLWKVIGCYSTKHSQNVFQVFFRSLLSAQFPRESSEVGPTYSPGMLRNVSPVVHIDAIPWT